MLFSILADWFDKTRDIAQRNWFPHARLPRSQVFDRAFSQRTDVTPCCESDLTEIKPRSAEIKKTVFQDT
ncbi:hypothetical protein YH62_27390 [Rhizobium sp. LC145]|nr:hypothetical protein YH62_27390 [Rhizobium sp. LC145]